MNEPLPHLAKMTGSIPPALVAISNNSIAEQRIAGVSAIGRVVRELVEAGFGEIHLSIPRGTELGAAACDDIRRLAPDAAVKFSSGPHGGEVIAFAPDCLVPAETIAAFAAGSARELLHEGEPVGWREGGEGSMVAAGALWLDRRAGWILLRRTGKSGDGLVSRWINRRVSRTISAFLLMFPSIRPIHGTIGTLLLGVAMVFALITGTQAGLVLGALLFQSASIFDGVDGEIARVTFRTSPEGAALDSAIDQATNIAFIIGMTFNMTVQGVESALYLGVWSLGAMALGLWLIARRTLKSGKPLGFDLIKHKMRARESGVVERAIIRFFMFLTARDGFAFLFAVLVASGLALVALSIFAAVSAIWLVTVIVSMFPGALQPKESAGVP